MLELHMLINLIIFERCSMKCKKMWMYPHRPVGKQT